MIKRVALIFFMLFGLFVEHGFATEVEHPQLKAFSPAKGGQERFVIVLPHKERGEEDDFTVEIIPGRMMLTDGVNQMRLGVTVTPKPLEGWGYTFYEVSGEDIAMSTMMAAPEGTEKIEKFVVGSSISVRYNSRLPIVIYAPEGIEVRYRIWQTSPDFHTIPRG